MALLAHVSRAIGARVGRLRPIYAHYGVTHRCNMRCRMCVVWKTARPETELRADQAERLAGNLRAAGVRTVALGGGEPFVRPDLPELIRAFAGRGFDVRVLTNGIGVRDEAMDAATAAGLRHVSISLDSVDARKEQDIYNGRDVWAQIVEALRRFRARLTSPGSMPILNVCVSRINLDELPALVRLAVEERYFCSFVPITLCATEAQSDGFAGVAPDLAVRPRDRERVSAAYEALLRMKRRGAPIANSSRFLRDSAEYLRTGRTPWTCDAGELYVSVSPDGGVSICHRFPAFARYDAPDLAARWRDPDFRREVRRQRAACPGCMRPCWAEVTHAVREARSGLEALRLVPTAARSARAARRGAAP